MTPEAATLTLGALSAATVLISLYVGSQVRLLGGTIRSLDGRVGRVEQILMTEPRRK